jgi:hypothetical protein
MRTNLADIHPGSVYAAVWSVKPNGWARGALEPFFQQSAQWTERVEKLVDQEFGALDELTLEEFD